MGEIQKHKEGRYQSYQDSSVGWLGQVPSHWQLRKLKHIFSEKKIVHNSLLSCGAISFGEVVEKNGTLVPHSTRASYQEVLSGEFLINPLNLNYDLKSLRIALSQMDVAVSSGYIVIKNHLTINKTYYKWLLHRYDVAYMKLLGSGVRQTINFNHIADSLLVLPPKNEQTAIANFLDGKTAKIDQAIVQKERMIQLLQERKQILIQNAVTKGLDPNVKMKDSMKDSGVEWIGEVPEHWTTIKLKFVTKHIYDGTHGSYPRTTKGFRLLSVRNIVNSEFVFREDDSRITKQHFQEINRKFSIKKGDIQLAIVGATLGKVAIVPDLNERFVTQRSLCSIRTNKLCSNRFLFFFIRSLKFQRYLWNNAGFSAQPGVYLNTIQNAHLSLPPFFLQLKIASELEKIDIKVSKTISKIDLQIEKLKEYKTTLIDHAVTGKIKVS